MNIEGEGHTQYKGQISPLYCVSDLALPILLEVNMKDSPHHRKHIKDKAIKEANRLEDSGSLPEDMIENPNFKKQFDARETCSLKKKHKHTKKQAKKPSPGEENKKDEPDHPNQENERWTQVTQSQCNQKTKKLNHQLNKHHKKAG